MSSVVLHSYSQEWPKLFLQVRQDLLHAFAPVLVSIEHIGSTSVPGLVAKPVIDVLLGASSLYDVESKIEALDKLGYIYVSKYEQELPMRRYFVKSSVDSLRIHLHAVETGSRFWLEHLAFRDLLCSDGNLRAKYQSLKIQLAQEHAQDKSAYSDAKGSFIQAALTTIKGDIV
ncbi:GrpB family protein [Undibacterium sp. TJN19]|uniref:GrpB family protein n=1 Tax=Undibacterium sp. TJN19 TaxID=3413055 RepID=UPI003BF1CFDA